MYRAKSNGEKGDCSAAIYGDHPEGISVTNVGLYGDSYPLSEVGGIKGYARQPDGETGTIAVTLHLPWFNVGGTFYVVDTDYTSYSIPYSCSMTLGFWKSE